MVDHEHKGPRNELTADMAHPNILIVVGTSKVTFDYDNVYA
jgi:hypothetical protein